VAMWFHEDLMSAYTDGIQATADPPRCKHSKLAGSEASFRHWHFCELPSGHDGPHCCMSCKAEFGR
jgi:hypothetical protein